MEGKKYLSSGLDPLTDAEREIICRQRDDIERELLPATGDEDTKTALMAEMLMALAGGAIDALQVRAKQSAYFIALEGIPAWSVRAAIDQWYGGKVKALKVGSDEYRWPPAPGVLAIICRSVLQPYKDAIENINDVLAAKPLDETLKTLHQRGGGADTSGK